MKDLYIVGAGGFGREVVWLVERINEIELSWNLKGFIDDDVSMHGKKESGYTILGGYDYLRSNLADFWVACAVGNAKNRKAIIEKIEKLPNIHYATLVDPSVQMGNSVVIGEGSIVCAGTIATVNISIGKHNIINLGCSIGHDVITESYVTLYPSVNISGKVNIGECTEVGTGSQIIQGIKVVSGCIIGAGAVVVKDIDEVGTYVGVPARNNYKSVRGGIRKKVNQIVLAMIPYLLTIQLRKKVA